MPDKIMYNRAAVLIDLRFVHKTGWPKIPEDHRIVNAYIQDESGLRIIVEGPSLPELPIMPSWSHPMVGWDLKPFTGDPRLHLVGVEPDNVRGEDEMSSGARPELEICPAGHRAERHIEAGCLHCFAKECKYSDANAKPRHVGCLSGPYPNTVATDIQGEEEYVGFAEGFDMEEEEEEEEEEEKAE